MTETIPCMIRVGDSVKKNKLIKLNHSKITVGRSGDVDYPILSTAISRCHAIIKQEGNAWTVTDNKSLNGVYVNECRLESNKPCILKDGDMVQFGVSASDVPTEYIYRFHSSIKVRQEGTKRKKDAERDLECEHGRDCVRPSKKKMLDMSGRSKTVEAANTEQQTTSLPTEKETEYETRLAQMEQLLKEKDRKQWLVEAQLEKERAEREKKANELKMMQLKEQAI